MKDIADVLSSSQKIYLLFLGPATQHEALESEKDFVNSYFFAISLHYSRKQQVHTVLQHDFALIPNVC